MWVAMLLELELVFGPIWRKTLHKLWCSISIAFSQFVSDTNIYLKEIFHVWQFSELISEPFMFSVYCWLMLSCHGFPLFKTVFPPSDPAIVFSVSPHRSCRIQSEIWTKRIFSPSSIHLIVRITSLVLFLATIDRISSDTNGWNENQEISFRRPELLVLQS